jgi:microcin C transport system permease protein
MAITSVKVKSRSQTALAWKRFKRHRRGYVSLILFSVLFTVSLFAEVVSNDHPMIVCYQGKYYFPVIHSYPETTFGGELQTETDYFDPYIQDILSRGENFLVFAPNPYSYNTINQYVHGPVPTPPSVEHMLGTDDRGRDVLARVIYGFRVSVIFGFALTAIGTVVGIILGAIQGYCGGRLDLYFQRFIEVWGAVPELYLLIIFASIFKPSLLLLLVLLSLFSWMGLSDYVRAEFLKGRNLEYVKAARALGVSNSKIMLRHLLPNSLTPVITFLPFRVSASILALTSLDFLGLGVPPSTPSLGEILSQGKGNIDAWWLSVSAFLALVGMLVLLIFIGEALRETFDPRK